MSDKATCSRCQSNPCCCTINNNPVNTNTFNPVINITTGSTEPPATANNALIGLNTTTPVQPNTPIPLDTNQLINGSAISHASPSPIINLAPNQTYLVDTQCMELPRREAD
ncbi:hypothetical protein J7I93_20910 [Bacillus sp. ISL-47]|uniref:hypothetical protein n=1 Tax=Bacillus sp. ISL-47 TaxID=2819130 RepID=UPI001BE52D07|nr:hypothetical protein [Bacillus sp. ISL-47]MBT2690620.1 hypothetical protein [Bacillus sp. ISL-47]